MGPQTISQERVEELEAEIEHLRAALHGVLLIANTLATANPGANAARNGFALISNMSADALETP